MSQEERLSLGFASPFCARGLDISLNRMSQVVSVLYGSSAFEYVAYLAMHMLNKINKLVY